MTSDPVAIDIISDQLPARRLPSRRTSEERLQVLGAFGRWYLSYHLTGLQDVNLVEAFKAGYTEGVSKTDR
jgi:hypothetical protein